MKKFLSILFVILISLIPINAFAADEDGEDDVDVQEEVLSQINGMDFSNVESIIGSLPQEAQNLLNNRSFTSYISDIALGNEEVSTTSILKQLANSFFSAALASIITMCSILVIVVLLSLLNSLKSSFNSEGVATVAHFTCYLMICALISSSVVRVIAIGYEAINSMTTYTQGIFPILLGLLTALGSTFASGILQPAMTVLTTVIAGTFKDAVYPLAVSGTALSFVSNISDAVNLEGVTKLIRSVCQWVMGIIFTVFLGVITIQGMGYSAIDGISIKTMKYTIDKTVPVVGGLFSDTVDTVLGCSIIAKNALGIGGLMLLILLIFVPVINMLATIFSFRLTASLVQVISEEKIAKLLNDIASYLMLVVLIVICIGIMFFITICIAIWAGNFTAMMR